MTKHTRHHANPNTIGKDPDIDVDTISFLEEDAAKQRGVLAGSRACRATCSSRC